MQAKEDNERIYDKNSCVETVILSSIGHRNEQQDCFGYSFNDNEALVVVCDGMGGHDKGKLASSTAIKTILKEYSKQDDHSEPIRMLDDLTLLANKEVCSIDSDNLAGTTMVLIYIKDNELYWHSVGDSRAYILRGSKYSQLTQDHNLKTVLEQKLSQGMISDSEYERDIVQGEALINYLGIEPLELIDYNIRPLMLEQNDEVIIMSDGLYKYLDEEATFEILRNFRNINDAVGALENMVERRSRQQNKDRDNMTVAIIKKL